MITLLPVDPSYYFKFVNSHVQQYRFKNLNKCTKKYQDRGTKWKSLIKKVPWGKFRTWLFRACVYLVVCVCPCLYDVTVVSWYVSWLLLCLTLSTTLSLECWRESVWICVYLCVFEIRCAEAALWGTNRKPRQVAGQRDLGSAEGLIVRILNEHLSILLRPVRETYTHQAVLKRKSSSDLKCILFFFFF